MDKNKNTNQTYFESCYRGRQSSLHHMAYMRMAKVLLALHVIKRSAIVLSGRSIFDYGFGAGTFFRYCPINSHLFGVEQDPENITSVINMLHKKRYQSVNLQRIDIEKWRLHPLLSQEYDLFLCSHVLEHLPDPVLFLKKARECIKPDGSFLGLVPINEISENPHHLQKINQTLVQEWASATNFSVEDYVEADELGYPIQPYFTYDSGWRHKIAQILSLTLGVPSSLLGYRVWWSISRFAASILPIKPSQAAFILKPK